MTNFPPEALVGRTVVGPIVGATHLPAIVAGALAVVIFVALLWMLWDGRTR